MQTKRVAYQELKTKEYMARVASYLSAEDQEILYSGNGFVEVPEQERQRLLGVLASSGPVTQGCVAGPVRGTRPESELPVQGSVHLHRREVFQRLRRGGVRRGGPCL